MATITLSIGAQSKSWTISPADAARVMAGLQASYGKVPVAGGGFRDRTPAEVFDMVASEFMASLKGRVRVSEEAAAVQAAAIIPIDMV